MDAAGSRVVDGGWQRYRPSPGPAVVKSWTLRPSQVSSRAARSMVVVQVRVGFVANSDPNEHGPGEAQRRNRSQGQFRRHYAVEKPQPVPATAQDRLRFTRGTRSASRGRPSTERQSTPCKRPLVALSAKSRRPTGGGRSRDPKVERLEAAGVSQRRIKSATWASSNPRLNWYCRSKRRTSAARASRRDRPVGIVVSAVPASRPDGDREKRASAHHATPGNVFLRTREGDAPIGPRGAVRISSTVSKTVAPVEVMVYRS